MYRDHRKGPGGPPGGATCPGGPRGLKVEGTQPLMGWGATLGLPPMRLGLGTLGGEFPLALGGKATPSPLVAAAPLEIPSLGAGAPQGAYITGGREGRRKQPWAPPSSPATPLSLSRRSSAKPCRRAATSTTTPSCCWISINLSAPLAGSRKEETSLHRTCVERGGAVRSALGHR